MKTDSLFYHLFKEFPELATQLLGLDYKADSYQFASEEVKQTAFRLDGIFMPLTDDMEQPVIFVEVQSQPDPDFYDRLFTEIALFLRRKKPWHGWQALVIYPFRNIERSANPAFMAFMGLEQLQVVYLEDFLSKEDLPPALGLACLIVCDESQMVARARYLVSRANKLLSSDMINFIETILVYKLPKLSREEVRDMLGLDENQLKKSVFYQEVLTEGREEGREETKHLWLEMLLTDKFGQLSDDVKLKLQAAHSVQLDSWVRRVLSADSLDDIFDDV